MISLSFYEERYKHQLYDFQLPTEQHQFTGLPCEILEQALEDDARFPVIILFDEIPVGFFILHKGEGIKDFSANQNALLLRALSINFLYQGKGYGKMGMELLPEFVKAHFPGVDEIVLAVNMRNQAAKKLYEKVGFIDKGERRNGDIGPQYILHFPII
jgi:RimJ/RimL family protein N-acetyltransferase